MLARIFHLLSAVVTHMPSSVLASSFLSLCCGGGILFAIEEGLGSPQTGAYLNFGATGVIGGILGIIVSGILGLYRTNRDARLSEERTRLEFREKDLARAEREADAERLARTAEADRRERMHGFDNKLNHYRLENEELRQENDRLRASLEDVRSVALENQDRIVQTEAKVERLASASSDSHPALPALTPGQVAGTEPVPGWDEDQEEPTHEPGSGPCP